MDPTLYMNVITIVISPRHQRQNVQVNDDHERVDRLCRGAKYVSHGCVGRDGDDGIERQW